LFAPLGESCNGHHDGEAARRDESAPAGKLVITTQRLDGNTCMKLFLLGPTPVVSFDMATNPGVGSRAARRCWGEF
jgi:hypothetical protein